MYKALSLRMACKSITTYLCFACSLLWISTPGFTAEPLKLANTNTLLTSLINLADDQDLYTKFGVELELTVKQTDEAAIRSLIDKQTDLAIVADAPFVRHALNHPNLRLIASIGQSDNEIQIAARKDRGISGPEDLRGKRVGTQPGVGFHLFLKRLLTKYGMTEDDVTQIFMPADRLPKALANGLIDAMSSREPYLSQALDLQHENLHIISAPGMYVKSFNLVTTDEFLRSDQAKSLIPLLQALNEAERRLIQQPDEMTALLSKHLKQTPEEVKHQLHTARLRLSMDSHQRSSLESIARWLQATPRSAKGTSITFAPYLHTPLLATVKPN